MKISLSEDPNRAREIGIALSRRGLVEWLISTDPQMSAVKDILTTLGFVEGVLYITGVALVSYMLSRKGEEHWLLAASTAYSPYEEALVRFVKSSPSLSRLRNQRLTKLSAYLESAANRLKLLLLAPEVDLDAFHSELVKAMRFSTSSKTAAFAAKMLFYSCLASGRRYRGGWRIPIPVDIRVALVTLTSGMIRGWSCSSDLLALASWLRSRWKPKLITLWNIASEEARMPPIVLDSAVWVPGRCVEEHIRLGSSLEECAESLAYGNKYYIDSLTQLWTALSACEERVG